MSQDLPGYFIDQTNRRLVSIENKLDMLIAFKWQIVGGSLVASTLIAIAVQVLLSK